MARMRDGVSVRHFIISEADLEDFAKLAYAAGVRRAGDVLLAVPLSGDGVEYALDQGVADFIQQHQGWMGDRTIGKGLELPPDAESVLTEEVRKIAVDTLYAAREQRKVMDQAALLVAANVLSRLEVHHQVIGYLRGRAATLRSEAALWSDQEERTAVLTERAEALIAAADHLQAISDEEGT